MKLNLNFFPLGLHIPQVVLYFQEVRDLCKLYS